MVAFFTKAIKVNCWREHVCVGCGAEYTYEFQGEAWGYGASAQGAGKRAETAAQKAYARSTRMHPCPRCGRYQPDMIGQRRRRNLKILLWIAPVPLAGTLIFFLSRDVQDHSLGTWAYLGVLFLLALLAWIISGRNPNAHLEANLQLAATRVAAGQIQLRPARLGAPETHLPARPGRTLWDWVALLTFLAAILLFAAPELARRQRGWPWNPNTDPAVLGPGDSAQIFLHQQIDSLNGYWTGQPVVTAQELGAGRPAFSLPSASNHDDWGTFIEADRDKFGSRPTLWVKVLLPSDPKLQGKILRLDIRLDLQYPQSFSHSSYREVSGTFTEQVDLNLASAVGAGQTYVNLWWIGRISGTAAIFAGLGLLIAGTHRLARSALPMRTHSAGPASTLVPELWN